MKRRRHLSGGSLRNANYYVKKFQPSKSGNDIKKFFKSVNSSSDQTDHTVELSSIVSNENPLSHGDDSTSQVSIIMEMCVAINSGI